MLHQIRLQPHHDWLRLGVAETAIELDDINLTALGNHQASIEKACVVVTICGHACNRRQDHLVHDALINCVVYHRCWRIGSHTASIWPLVAIISSLMVLRGSHWQDIASVYHGDKAGLFAF